MPGCRRLDRTRDCPPLCGYLTPRLSGRASERETAVRSNVLSGAHHCHAEHVGHEPRLRQRVRFAGFQRVAVMRTREIAFQRFVLSCHLGMRAQIVSKRQVLPLLLPSSVAEMNMM